MLVLRVMLIQLLCAAAPPAQRYVLDSTRSDISAKVAFFGIASKTAHFPQASGSIAFDPHHPQGVELRIVLNAEALTAPDPVTLARLKGPAFFDVDHYPTIVFQGETMRMSGERDAVVGGTITARGITRPATLAVQFAEPPASATGRPLRLEGTTTIDRTEYGMTAYRFIVGRKVTVTIRATMIPA